MKPYEILLKAKEIIDEHRTAFDISIGGGVGFFPSIVKYWEHFTQQENQFHFYDGIVNTIVNTLVGAFILWMVHKFVLKTKKEGK
jgi:hypothetical protein